LDKINEFANVYWIVCIIVLAARLSQNLNKKTQNLNGQFLEWCYVNENPAI
jgi:hypothetical protein